MIYGLSYQYVDIVYPLFFLYLNVTEDLQIIPRLKTLIVDYANYRPM